tara:strand:+ start:28287 stop:29489 length:1203 start_codon:yes stop_codon:yes gene_type:complete
MGFIASANTITITAKLTPFGRQQLLTNSSSIITQFSLGDSDASYLGELPLDIGRVPALAGEIGTNEIFSNGLWSGVAIESPIVVNGFGDTRKPVQAGSNQVVITPVSLGVTGITGTSLTQLIVDRTEGDTDGNANLFKSFGLPLTQNDKNLYTTFVSPLGYLDTAIRNFNQDKVLVIAIDKCMYGEILDGKSVHIELETTGATTYNLYTTFQKSLTPSSSLDGKVSEELELGAAIGKNIAFLFSDEVQRPNGDPSKSWATGSGQIKSYSLNGKETFNSVSVPSTSTSMDLAVGIAYLDKGIIVITHPDIVNNYDPLTSGSGTTVTYNHISNEVAQNITCVVERNEFASTTNNTWSDGDLIRVSEMALYDTFNNVIAYAKSNDHIIIGASQYMVLGVRILV